MLTVAICEDEPQMAKAIAAQLAGYMAGRPGLAYKTALFPSGTALLQSGKRYDLVFLDIRMEGLDGIETARRLRAAGMNGPLVFVTVLREWALDAFELDACDYLLKPLNGARFARTMDRALARLAGAGQGGTQSLLVRSGKGCEVVPFAAILYCEVKGRVCYLHKTDGSVTGYPQKISRLARQLDARFFCCHRSYLVNLDHVLGYGGGRLSLPGGETIPVSRLRGREFGEALLRRIKEREGQDAGL